MDGLPVPKKKMIAVQIYCKGMLEGNAVPVMHACGHDTPLGILNGSKQKSLTK